MVILLSQPMRSLDLAINTHGLVAHITIQFQFISRMVDTLSIGFRLVLDIDPSMPLEYLFLVMIFGIAFQAEACILGQTEFNGLQFATGLADGGTEFLLAAGVELEMDLEAGQDLLRLEHDVVMLVRISISLLLIKIDAIKPPGQVRGLLLPLILIPQHEITLADCNLDHQELIGIVLSRL
jgi:hypothetical protein